jgi:chromosome segregation ATPase
VDEKLLCLANVVYILMITKSTQLSFHRTTVVALSWTSNKSRENQEKNISAAPSSSLFPMDPPTKQLSSYDSGNHQQRTRSFCGEPTARPLLHSSSSSSIRISDPEREMKKLTVLLKEKDKQMKALERTLSLKEMKLEECLRNEQKLRHNENEFFKLISSQSTTERRQDVIIRQGTSVIEKIAQELQEELERIEESYERQVQEMNQQLFVKQEELRTQQTTFDGQLLIKKEILNQQFLKEQESFKKQLHTKQEMVKELERQLTQSQLDLENTVEILSSLEDDCQSYEMKISELNQKNSQLTHFLTETREDAEKEIETLKEEMRIAMEERQVELAALRAKLTVTEEQLQRSQQQETLPRETTTLSQINLQQVIEEKDPLERSFSESIDQVHVLRRDLLSSQSEIQDMTSQLEERKEIIHRLHLTNDTLATSLDQLQRTSSSTIKTLQEELQATRDEIVSLHSMLKRSDELITETKMTLDLSEEKVTTLTEEVSDSCCHRITILSDDLSTLRGSLESTELTLIETQATLTQVISEKVTLECQLTDLTERSADTLTQLNSQISSLQTSLRSTAEERTISQSALKLSEQEVSHLSDQNKTLTNDLHNCREEVADIYHQLRSLETTLNLTQATLTDCETHLMIVESEKTTLQSKLNLSLSQLTSDLTSEITTTKIALNDTKVERIQALQQSHTSESQLEESREQTRALSSDLTLIQTKFTQREEEIHLLQTSLDRVHLKLSESESKLLSSQDEVTTLHLSLNQSKSQLAALLTTENRIQSLLSQSVKEKPIFLSQIQEMRSTNRELESELNRVKTLLKQSDLMVMKQASDKASLQSIVQDLEQRLSVIKEEYKALSMEKRRNVQLMEGAKGQIYKLNQMIESLRLAKSQVLSFYLFLSPLPALC